MPQHRDLNRTRERIIAAAQKEFAANGFAGARTDAIARRAGINERMIFYCFNSKEGLFTFQGLYARTKTTPPERASSNPRRMRTSRAAWPTWDFFLPAPVPRRSSKLWQWEALDKRGGKLVAETERRAFFQSRNRVTCPLEASEGKRSLTS